MSEARELLKTCREKMDAWPDGHVSVVNVKDLTSILLIQFECALNIQDQLTTELAASRAREAIVRDECTQYDRNCGLTASDLVERIMRELTAPAALSASEDAK